VSGGSGGIGFAVADALARRGERIVLTSRDVGRAEAAARKIGGDAVGLAIDLAEPTTIAAKPAGLGPVDHLAMLANERDRNTVRDYNIGGALRAATVKLVGYVEIIHAGDHAAEFHRVLEG